MSSEERWDVVVIGAGTAGQTAAHALRQGGRRVAIVDERPYGGTCALRGCDPKKTLVGIADAVESARRLQGKGVEAPQARIDWAAAQRFKREFTGPVPARVEASLEKAGVARLHGPARFVAEDALEMEGRRLRAESFVIATGARPRPLGIPGEEHVTTSEAFLETEALPPRVLFIGGGYISFEFAHLCARAGAAATILHRGERPLEAFDAGMVERLTRHTRDLGVDVRLRTAVEAVEQRAGVLVARTAEGEHEAEMVVHGAGRVPALDALALEAANVERGKRGVKVDEHLRSTSNPRVYAAGDAAAGEGAPLTPVASLEGEVVAHNILTGDTRTPDYRGVASVVFTIPPLAMAGLTEEQARAQGVDVEVHTAETTSWFSSWRLNAPVSAYKVLVEKASGRVVGAHLLGPHAEEVINVLAVAIRFGIRMEELTSTLFAYPSTGSDIVYMG